ncbi:putative acetamidase [[Candida] jaroonii]|uniref:Acetamidase n=1 Tax=[Candida] jaroonii TaxID=467808 RepID=A0ACA9YD94_9ASCO|nr:putative acetamidase [[Candida] jaroonii]
MTVTEPTYKTIAAKKLKERDEKFIKEWLIAEDQLPDQSVKDVTKFIEKNNLLTPSEVEITESDAPTIVGNIKSKKWRAVQVMEAFGKRATIAHQLTNCLSEIFFEEGLQTAKELDEYQDKTGETKGPLHGLPFSVKDNFNVKGHDSTIGMVNLSFKKVDNDAVLVDLLRKLGAVLYVKTNVPVAMMMPETNNHIFGNTTNPMNRALSAGGSSGGECALIRMKGAPIGVGSDIGGSLRIPASFQNLYTLRPSFGRFPTYGCTSGLPGLESVNSVNGPISTSLESMELYCKSIIDSEPWLHDGKVIELPWRDVELPSKLNIAVLVDDGYVRPTPPIRRGMKIAIDKLKEAGHDIIEWDGSDHVEMAKIIGKFFLSDGGHHIKQITEPTGEPFFEYMKGYESAQDLGVPGLWKLHAERTSMMKKFLDKWNNTSSKTANGKPIDAIIMPATPFAGSPNHKFRDYVGYTSPFNLVDYSAGIIPVTRADKDLDPKDPVCTNYSNSDKMIWEDYDPEETHGGAVSIQIVGRRLQEEKVIKMMKVVSSLLDDEI